MNKEQLITKGVSRKFDGQQVWFEVASLKEHYEGIQYHESDLDDSGFLKVADIFGDDIREIEAVAPVAEEEAGFPVWVNPPLEEIAEIETIVEVVTADETPLEEVVVAELPVLDETPDSEA
jgi:hypothetical protein